MSGVTQAQSPFSSGFQFAMTESAIRMTKEKTHADR